MSSDVTRRGFLTAGAGVAAALTAVSSQAEDDAPEKDGPTNGGPVKIIAIASSPRKGKTTAAGLAVCLEAAKAVDERIQTELIELAGLKIPGEVAAGIALEPGERDDFPAIAEKLSDPAVRGILIGTPVYFANMSALCKAFLDRWVVFRKTFALSNRVGGVLAVGSGRNAGVEQTIRSVQAALFAQEMIVVGDGQPTGHFGATLWNNAGDDISKDEAGIKTAQNLGRRVAEVALKIC